MHLSDGPLFRAALYRWRDADRLLLVAHHLAVDGVTWRILLEDLEAALAGTPLLERTDSLSTWADAQHAAAAGGRVAAELPLWKGMDDSGGTAIDPDPRLHDRGSYGDAVEELLDWTKKDTADLRDACAAYQTNIGELVLAGAARALGRWTGRETMQIALEGHGRDALPDVDVSRTAGWFTAIYPVVVDLADGPVHQRVRALKETLRRIPGGGAGYGILRYLSPDGPARGLRARPPVCFNYLGDVQVAAGGTFAPCGDRIAAAASPRGPRPFAVEIAAIVADGALRVALTFAGRTVDRAVMRRLRDALDEELRHVVAHCLGRTAPELTPADLTHKALTLEELDGLFDDD
jgi:non-ribosomal peptide synthase protein (TIGR01720 family)